MAHKIKAMVGFELDSPDTYEDDYAFIVGQARDFMANKPDGKYLKTTCRWDSDEAIGYAHLHITIPVENVAAGETLRQDMLAAITAVDGEGDPIFPPLLEPEEKGFTFDNGQAGV